MILVTGAAGMLGSSLIQELLANQQSVKALYRSAKPTQHSQNKVVWIQGDILDVSRLEEVMQGVTQVYHCAAIVSFSHDDAEELYKTNVEGTANVVNAALNAGVKKLLHISSVAALGKAKTGEAVSESSQWTEDKNSSVYGKTKHLAEMEVWRGVGEGLDAVVINPGIILGSGDWNEGSSRLFKTAYDEFPWFTEGVTGFVDVLDVAKAAILLMNNETAAERFIINADNIPYHELFNLMADGFGKKRAFRKVSPFMASLIWRTERMRHFFFGSRPFLTKETAANAQTKRYFDNTKLLRRFPQFHYLPLQQTISRICNDYKQEYSL